MVWTTIMGNLEHTRYYEQLSWGTWSILGALKEHAKLMISYLVFDVCYFGRNLNICSIYLTEKAEFLILVLWWFMPNFSTHFLFFYTVCFVWRNCAGTEGNVWKIWGWFSRKFCIERIFFCTLPTRSGRAISSKIAGIQSLWSWNAYSILL